MTTNLGRVGGIGRFKPLHNGGAVMLEAICRNSREVVIGIGSCNKYNVRNPFTACESETMLKLFLAPRFNNFSVVQIPDFAQIPEYSDGRKWKEYVIEKFGALDYFATSNDYVSNLLQDAYKIFNPLELIPKENQVPVKSTLVRVEMAKYGNWRKYVPQEVSRYLEESGIVSRFQQEFGLQTLALLTNSELNMNEDADQEKDHAQEL